MAAQTKSTSVVVTGLGVLTPIGTTVAGFWDAAVRGVVGTAPLRRADAADFPARLAGEVAGFEAPRATGDRGLRLATAAVSAAAADAGISEWTGDPYRAGVCLGTLLGGRAGLEPAVTGFHRGTEPQATPYDAGRPVVDFAAAVARERGFLGPGLTVATACASGNSALAHAADTIRAGRADVMIAGGVDELSSGIMMMFSSLRSLAPDCLRPFDRNRAGLVVSEGAAALVLEPYEHARRRGAHIYAELAGWASASDAHHMTAPHPQGSGARRSMLRALERAGISPDRVDHVSAHGTGTPSNDRIEAQALLEVFGPRTPAVTSLKGALGHTQGAASAIEAVACVLALRDGVIPPTANLVDLDPECAVDVVRGEARETPVRVAVNNAFGFGGNTACTVFTRLATTTSTAGSAR
ncbi:3-oxoacyl-[acyl-carrier-protein] synthase II [Streptomyces sp. Ncost-T6T-1]|uniref:beta-ketoacyl-[acyl-carrier-protein] synthase family protein n=1 Tax=Streptomyces sp. Ncost-T6T-1 TaxID=1100828 RepID=UPI0008059695|nr:beta-ketoacyl-[acyl-carrier-protein] synthase family protein [Streptomyces sp. Ncost-T6T-1]SBU98609.1 3-oxoacyl-[acyl-carrier-protein] synthase II [Streptomyces sp. Ncost-T6T-1]